MMVPEFKTFSQYRVSTTKRNYLKQNNCYLRQKEAVTA